MDDTPGTNALLVNGGHSCLTPKLRFSRIEVSGRALTGLVIPPPVSTPLRGAALAWLCKGNPWLFILCTFQDFAEVRKSPVTSHLLWQGVRGEAPLRNIL